MKDVRGILEFLGYREICPEDVGEWLPIKSVNGRYGTTDRTEIIRRKGAPTARLVDRETGELVAMARRSCSLQQTAESHA